MDPIIASTTLATIVGLICDYNQERETNKGLAHRNFIEWLEYHRHENIKNLITNTHGLQEEVNQLLRQDHAEILKKLDLINNTLSQVLSRISGFELFAQEFGNSARLSDQAFAILQQFANSTGKEMSYDSKSAILLLLPIRTGSISVSNQRFLHDDLQTLESLGFIQLARVSSGGNSIFSLTRNGAAYVKMAK